MLNKVPLLVLIVVLVFLFVSVFTFISMENVLDNGRDGPMPQSSAGGIVRVEIVAYENTANEVS